jgi:hypothetical protein
MPRINQGTLVSQVYYCLCKDIILKGFLSFSGKIGSRPVFCRLRRDGPRWGEKARAVGFLLCSDTSLFYRMVQVHPREMRFWPFSARLPILFLEFAAESVMEEGGEEGLGLTQRLALHGTQMLCSLNQDCELLL